MQDIDTINQINQEEESITRAGAYDWHHMDLIENPPYSHADMIKMLANGRFIVEGKPSNYDLAETYAMHYDDNREVWQTMRELSYQTDLALGEIPY